VVEDRREGHPVEERGDTPGVDRVEGVRHPDVLEARVGEDFGFAELGATDAHGTRGHLLASEARELVRLGVRPQRDRSGIGGGLHPLDVPQ
jgi:hypothetical protein